MSKRVIHGWMMKMIAFALSFSLIIESSLVGYAANSVVYDTDMETASELEADEEESIEKDVSEEAEMPEETSEEVTEGVEEISSEDSEDIDEEESVEESEAEEEEVSKDAVEVETEIISVYDMEDSFLGDESQTESVFVINDGILISYTGNENEIVIPEGVIEIADEAFRDMHFITSVIFPTSLKSIDDYAFAGCSGLAYIQLNEGIETIGECAFYGAPLGWVNEKKETICGTLSIPSTVSYIGDEAFGKSAYLGEVFFANGTEKVLELGDSVFKSCVSLNKVTMPDRATAVSDYAFQYCSLLEEVDFGKNIQTIGAYAFNGCSLLNELNCPDSLLEIGEWAFSCKNLAMVELNEGLQTIGRGAFYGAALGGLDEKGVAVYGTLVIPSTVSYIGEEAFCSCAYLGEVIFLNGTVDKLEFASCEDNNSMFRACPNLKKVTLSDRATVVPAYAFQNCPLLEEINYGKNINKIESHAFNKCPSLKELVCPGTLKEIGEWAFSGCEGMLVLTLNEGLEKIGAGAFYGASIGGKNGKNTIIYGTLTIPTTVSYLGHEAFCHSTYLGEVIFLNGTVTDLEFGIYQNKSSVFRACSSLKKVTLPDRATVVPAYAFQNCPLLEEINFGKNINKIESHAFNASPSLKEMVCPESLKEIGEWAFSGCSGLTTIVLNEGLETIGNGCFYEAGVEGVNKSTKLTYSTLTIPSTLRYMGTDAFFNCREYETIVFSNGTNDLLEFADDMGQSRAFKNCLNLKVVYLPERLWELKASTFLNCQKLETLFVPKTVEVIDDDCLKYCDVKKLVIYGTPGSAAERFALNNNITFKSESDLGIYAKSIHLNYENLTFVGQENLGKNITLIATVLPAIAQDKSLVYASDNTKVATVTEAGIITITGYGEANIVVTSKENANVFKTCRIKVLKNWTQEELDSARTYIQQNNDFTLLTNVSSDLQKDCHIQAGEGIVAEWKLPYEIESGTHTYDIVLKKDGYPDAVLEDIPVTGVEITGIVVDGPKSLQVNKEAAASVTIVAEGGEISPDDYIVEWKSASVSKITAQKSLTNPLAATVKGLAVNKGTNVTVRVLLRNGDISVTPLEEERGKTWFEAKLKVAVTEAAMVDALNVAVTQNGQAVLLESLNSLVNADVTNKYELNAVAYANGTELENIPLLYKSSNVSVATVKKDKNGKVILSILQKGTSVITVAATKNGGYSTSFRVTVKDSTPRLLEKKITINRYLEAPYGYVTILPSDGYLINPDSLAVVNKQTDALSEYGISHVTNNTYKIFVRNGKKIQKGEYSFYISAKTVSDSETVYKLPITIKVVEELPKVTMEQTAIATYYKDAQGTIKINTAATIADMSFVPNAGAKKARLIQKYTDTRKGTINIVTDNVNASNYTKVANKGVVRVQFEGYINEAVYMKTINLSIDSKQPVIEAIPQSATLYPETLADTTGIILYNKGAKEDITATNGYEVELLNKKVLEGKGFVEQIDSATGQTSIRAIKGATKGNLTYSVKNSKWLDGVTVNASCSLKTKPVPTLTFGNGKIILNTAYTMADSNAVSAKTYIKGFEHIVFDSHKTVIKGKDSKSQKALDDAALLITMEDGMIKAGVMGNGYFTKNATYSYAVTAYSKDNMPVSGTLKIQLVTQKNKPKVSFKTKGSINLLDRETTFITAIPTVKNYTASVIAIDLVGPNSGKFTAKMVDGAIFIKAISGRSIKANTKYTLQADVTLDTGVHLQTKIAVTPKQKAPKLVQSTNTIVLFESVKGIAGAADISIATQSGQNVTIKSIQMGMDSDAFGYSGGKIYVKDTATILPGKTYTIKLAVTYKDHAKNVKPTYVNVKVDYRK